MAVDIDRLIETETSVVKSMRTELSARVDALDGYTGDDKVTGYESAITQSTLRVLGLMRKTGALSLAPLCPALFSLKGKPFSLQDHFMFEPLYATRTSRRSIDLCARQVAKSTNLAATMILRSAVIPHYQTLVVTPLFEMVRRFSNNYVKTFIESSPVRRLMKGDGVVNQVLQRGLSNGSTMHFSYALRDAERTRGVPASEVDADEVQNFEYEVLMLVLETLGASEFKTTRYFGTPKSIANTASVLWEQSSQAEWVTKCRYQGCGHWNIPHLDYDLLKMIGKPRPDISEKRPGVVCAKCRQPILPRLGHWLHKYKKRRFTFAGRHIPQIILPLHYRNVHDWTTLYNKSLARAGIGFGQFLNEVCGVATDHGTMLIGLTDVLAAAILPWPNNKEIGLGIATGHGVEGGRRRNYARIILSIDWGGGGGVAKVDADGKQRTSFTVYVITGQRPDGKIETIYAHKSLMTNDHAYEGRLALKLFREFGCSHVVHDYSNAGSVRETIMLSMGKPGNRLSESKVIPATYHGNGRDIFVYQPSTDVNHRRHLSIDKAFSLATLCQCVKLGIVLFFKDDYVDTSQKGLLRQFLSLVEEKIDGTGLTDRYRITKHPNEDDDFVQALNIGCCAHWLLSGKLPDFSDALKYRVDRHMDPGMHGEILTADEWAMVE